MEELKPCPFCGGEAKLNSINLSNPFWVSCTFCGASAGPDNGFHCVYEAVDAWNRRAAPENKTLSLEQLKNMRGEAVWVKDLCSNEIQCLQFDDFKPATYHKGNDVRFNQFGTKTGIIWWCCKYGETWLPYASKPEAST